jgi:imidazolonepropionase-like amidohydrolase
MKTLILGAAAAVLLASPLGAQTVAIQGGKVYTMTGAPVENGTVVVRDGKIVAVGAGVAVPAGARVIDARGKVVTPGFFDSETQMGLTEVDAVDDTNDYNAQDQLPGLPRDYVTAAFNVGDGINPNSIVIPVTRIAGVTTAVSSPTGGLIAGQGVVIDLAGTRADELMVKSPVAMFAWVDLSSLAGGGGARAGVLLRLREVLDDARFYGRNRVAFDRGESRALAESRLDLEALQPVLAGTLPLAVEVHRASDIRNVLALAEEYHLQLILIGATEGWMVADEIAKAGVPVIVKVLANLPVSFERLGARYDNAAILREHGVKIAITPNDTHNSRNIAQEAGNAVAYGLPYEEALRAITRSPAEIWGVPDHGSLAPGQVADLVVWSGDPLELLTSVEHVLIAGREIPLTSRQTELRDRYREPGSARRAYP